MSINPESAQKFMQEALLEARAAKLKGEVPVGAVVVFNNQIVARAHNETEAQKDATLHAEILAIRRASAALQSWRLNEAQLFVTLEPCPMCVGAIGLSRIGTVVFGARDPRMGAMGSIFDISKFGSFEGPRVISDVLEDEALALLKEFFAGLRA